MPLDPGFADARGHARARGAAFDMPPKRISSDFGARDNTNRAGLALDALADHAGEGAPTVVLAGTAPHIAAFGDWINNFVDVRKLIDHPDMIELYESATLAVGAPGMSLYERLWCGLPSVLVCQSDERARLADWTARTDTVVVAQTAVASIQDAVRRWSKSRRLPCTARNRQTRPRAPWQPARWWSA